VAQSLKAGNIHFAESCATKAILAPLVVGAAQRWVWNILSQIICLQINNLGSWQDVLMSSSAAKGVIRLDSNNNNNDRLTAFDPGQPG